MAERIAGIQPGYLPWLGYFDQMMRVDAFLVADELPFSSSGWVHRNRVKGRTGPVWLTLPARAEQGARISEVSLDPNVPWARKHLATLRHLYARAPGAPLVVPVAAGSAVALNVTAVDPVTDGYVTVHACGTPLPPTSTVNVRAGSVAPNVAVVAPGADGTVCVVPSTAMHLLVDQFGSFGASAGVDLPAPERAYDSRSGGVLAGGTVVRVPVGATSGTTSTATISAAALKTWTARVFVTTSVPASWSYLTACWWTTFVASIPAPSATAAFSICPAG